METEVGSTIFHWLWPELPPQLKVGGEDIAQNFAQLCLHIRARLAEMPAGEEKASLELSAAHWVYDFIRANIKRGRLFSLDA
ncbi:MAG: hypothetical protein HY664_04110, partial [Chloroflexi bacterium]|nr:hypothetical protein [Chloroflexota bacterium]